MCRIISEFHDYYDVVQKLGQDDNLLYLRKPEEFSYKSNYPFPAFHSHQMWYRGRYYPELEVEEVIVGFCGKIYPALKLRGKYNYDAGESPTAICYNIEEVDRFIEANYREKEILEYRMKPRRRWTPYHYWSHGCSRISFEKWFAECREKQNNFAQLFLDHKCPVFVAAYQTGRRGEVGKIVYSACLKEYEFVRIFDPFTAFQEISMYFGGLAQPNRPIPEVSDSDMIIAKGFDEWSFRKESKKKKTI